MTRQKVSPQMYQSKYAKVGSDVQPISRMTVHATVTLPSGEWDPIRGVAPDRSPRAAQAARKRQMQLEEKERAREKRKDPKRGFSLGFAAVLTAVMMLALGMTTLVRASEWTRATKTLGSLNGEIKTLRATNEELSMALSEATDITKICYAAARNLGMVPSTSTEVMYLLAPETRTETAGELYTPPVQTGFYATIFSFLE